MRFCIHRGTQEIGGTCVEVEAQGFRILLDLGQPLDAPDPTPDLLPAITGLSVPGDPSLLGIVLSHSHRDHWGLIPFARPDLPVIMGAATYRMMQAAVPFVPGMVVPGTVRTMADREPFDLGPFRITPFTVDHSAYDAYALLVEADGRRLFYSGDLRAHGRKGALFERMLRQPPNDIDVLMLEGTTLGCPQIETGLPTETEIEQRMVDTFEAAPGMVLVCASAQNIDRMVTLYRAAKRTGRTLLIDLYAAEMLRATGNPNIPQSDWTGVALFTPHYQRLQIKKSGLFATLDDHKANRLFPEALKARAADLVMLFRPAMLNDLRRADCLSGARAVWSQWEGYLSEKQGATMKAAFETLNIPLTTIHTSGHASRVDLQRLATAVNARQLVPIHTAEGRRYPQWFENVVACANGEWKEI